jgi:hypothetical protein
MSENLVSIRPGYETVLSDGTRITAEPISNFRINRNPSEVALHEAYHVLAAILQGVGVKRATVVPEGDALGVTEVTQFDPVVAAAAHAFGCDGCGHDLTLVMLSGHDVGSSASAARSLLSGYEDEIFAIATLLDERKSVDGSEAIGIVRHIDEVSREEELMVVKVTAPNGTRNTHTKRLHDGTALIINNQALEDRTSLQRTKTV